jgi:hypothetical protein
MWKLKREEEEMAKVGKNLKSKSPDPESQTSNLNPSLGFRV